MSKIVPMPWIEEQRKLVVKYGVLAIMYALLAIAALFLMLALCLDSRLAERIPPLFMLPGILACAVCVFVFMRKLPGVSEKQNTVMRLWREVASFLENGNLSAAQLQELDQALRELDQVQDQIPLGGECYLKLTPSFMIRTGAVFSLLAVWQAEQVTCSEEDENCLDIAFYDADGAFFMELSLSEQAYAEKESVIEKINAQYGNLIRYL